SMRHLYTSRPYPPGWSRFTRFAASRRYDGQDAASRRSIMGPGPRLATLALACAMAIPADAAPRDARYASERRQMVAEIQAMARAAGRETGRAAFSAEVLRAMATVPRHRFVPAALAAS